MDMDDDYGPAYAYLGHFVKHPTDVALIAADQFLEVLDVCDMVGQPDEGSFEGLRDPLVLRFRAQLVQETDDDDVEIEYVRFNPHPKGVMALAGRDLGRLRARIKANQSTVTGDVLRSLGPVCPKCRYQHNDWQECKAFLEKAERHALYLGYLNDDPQDIFVVAGPHDDDFEQVTAIAGVAGKAPRVLTPVPPGVLFNLRLDEDGVANSVPEFACYCQDDSWLDDLKDLLRGQ